MSKYNYVIILGLLIAVLPFLGLPYSLKKWGAFVFGVLIAVITFWIKWRVLKNVDNSLVTQKNKNEDIYVESDLPAENTLESNESIEGQDDDSDDQYNQFFEDESPNFRQEE